MPLQTSVEQIPYIGPTYARKLAKLSIYTLQDLLYHIPSRYEDTTQVSTIENLQKEDTPIHTIQGHIREIRNVYTRYGKKLTEAVIEDATGVADIIWFNQHYLTKTLTVGTEILLSGKVTFDSYIRPKFISPSYELKRGSERVHLGKFAPIYPETEGISSKWLRARIHETLPKARIEEWLPEELLHKENLLSLQEAIHALHEPKSIDEAREGKLRIAFDEMLLIQLFMQERRNLSRSGVAQTIPFDETLLKRYIASLPFSLTKSQEDSIHAILQDLSGRKPMNRLLEGEVGSGKTVVAGAAVFMSLMAQEKVCMMAPTSILAKQHYDTFTSLLTNLGIDKDEISLVTNRYKANNNAHFFIGTQALLFKEDLLEDISLAIIDEQHRFGVQQRETLSNAHGNVIHTLTMTATPIPRTLALSIYGDLDISYLSELPKGRKAIMTRIVPDKRRDDLYTFVEQHIKEGRQAFIICPLVNLSDKLNVKSAQEEFLRLQHTIFPNLRLILLHGQMKPQEKDKILEDFKNKEYDILVSTPVVEVGIDIPNANIMVIEGAERFGLAQLHQLRGRVGRGAYESFCFLLTSEVPFSEKERLQVFAQNSSGLKIAEFDLKNRGPGEVYGVRQSGLPILKAASILDLDLITRTKKIATHILTNGLTDTHIKKKLLEFKEYVSKLN